MLEEEINDTCPPSKLKNVFSGELLSSFSEFRDDGVRISHSLLYPSTFCTSGEGFLGRPRGPVTEDGAYTEYQSHLPRVNSPKLQIRFSHLPSVQFCLS